jgi:hypothetical protein
MRVFALLCVSAYCAASWLVGLRLLRLAARTGEAPERLIGSTLLAGGAIGYPANVAALLFAGSAPDLALRIGVASVLALGVASGGILLAWRTIYHPADAWARRLATLLLVLLAFSVLDRLAGYDPAAVALSRGRGVPRAFLLSVVAGAVPYAANTLSGLRYHAMLRKRIPLGLADPAVANRVLLWSLTSCAVVAQYACTLASLWAWRWFDPTQLTTAVVGSLGLSIATLLLLSFFPPPAYLRWLQRRTSFSTSQ